MITLAGKLPFNLVRLLYVFVSSKHLIFAPFRWRPVFRIRKFLGLPDSDQLVRGTDPDPSSSINGMKNLYLYSFVTSVSHFIFEEWCKCTFKKYLIRKKFVKIIFCCCPVLKVNDGHGSEILEVTNSKLELINFVIFFWHCNNILEIPFQEGWYRVPVLHID